MIGTTVANYRITSALGVGGMGEVWRAEDTRLGREVALKVLPEDFADDPDRHARFEREAQVLASLNHPNIATLHALEHLDGKHVLVMELVEGEGLDEVIARGPIPLDDAVAMALQIAEALEAAHESGIVHRDLKPANIRVRPDGTVKVLDFGLAKAWETQSSDSSLSLSPTMTKHATAAGVILGTAAYMSPEQARGKQVDRRADIWSFGVVLWEMLTGEKLFEGETVSDVLAAVLTREPDLGDLPADVPSAIRHLISRCLVRDPRQRLRDIGEARIALDNLASGDETEFGSPPGMSVDSQSVRPRNIISRLLPWALALAGFAAAAGLWAVVPRRTQMPPRLVTSILSPTEGGFDIDRGLALSPDGNRLVVSALDDSLNPALWLMDLTSGDRQMLEGTDGASSPFWSPDGRSIAFEDDATLKRIDIRNGVVETISDDLHWVDGGAWSPLGSIVVGSGLVTQMRTFSPNGDSVGSQSSGEATGSELLAHPCFLPDGRNYLYLARRYASDAHTGEIRIASLDNTESRVLLQSNSNALYAEPGYLLWWRDGNLRAQRFDPDRLELVGKAEALIPDVRFRPGSGRMAVTVSNTGLLVYQTGGEQAGDELVLLDRRGVQLAQVAPQGSYYGPRLSPDGRRVVADVSDATNKGDLWVFNIDRGTGSRLTLRQEDETRPRWSGTGEQIVYTSMADSERMAALWVCDARSGAEPRLLAADPKANLRVTDWASDGRVLLDWMATGKDDIYVYSPDDELRLWLATPFVERSASASPNSDYVAYVSEDSGRAEIWVRSFSQTGEAWQVSVDGGDWPAWRADGNEVYFLDATGWMQAVTVTWHQRTSGPVPEFGKPERLFRMDSKSHMDRQYDTLDGETFVVNRAVRTGAGTPLTLVQGWAEGLSDR